jgi:hypothetical protein
MSGPNLETVELGVAALNETYRTRDMDHWRRFVEAHTEPDLVLEAPSDAFTEGVWRGRQGVVDFVANQMEVLDEHTGIEVDFAPVHVLRYRDGKAVEWQIFLERDEALATAGLSD